MPIRPTLILSRMFKQSGSGASKRRRLLSTNRDVQNGKFSSSRETYEGKQIVLETDVAVLVRKLHLCAIQNNKVRIRWLVLETISYCADLNIPVYVGRIMTK